MSRNSRIPGIAGVVAGVGEDCGVGDWACSVPKQQANSRPDRMQKRLERIGCGLPRRDSRKGREGRKGNRWRFCLFRLDGEIVKLRK